MERFVSFTIRQRVVFNLFFVLLMVIGAMTLLRMPVERYPNIQFGKMYVNTYFPGGSPKEVENLVTKKVEESLEDVEDIEYVRSSSYRERSSIVIKFVDDSDYEKRFNDVRLKVLSIVNELPETIEPPVFNFLDVNDWFPTISVNVSGLHTNTSLSLVAEELKILLAQLDGVKEVKQSGDYTREYHAILSSEKLLQKGLTYTEVVRALEANNIQIPAGHVTTEVGELVAKVDEQVSNRSTLLQTVLRVDGEGSFLRLVDVVDQDYFSYRDPFIMTSVNGMDCVTLQVLKHSSGNALFIAKAVRELVSEVQPVYEEHGIVLEVTQDSSIRIFDSVRVLGVNLLLGVILVCFIIWLFMGFRNAALTTIGIPFAFLVTMVFMYLTGNSVNEVSLFAFVLVSGIIVDDAIVVVENIYRHLQAGLGRIDAVVKGTAEVFLPVVSATLTTIVAFLPMLIMTGMVGDFFEIIPKTIAFALAASLLECLLILPCHYLEFGPREVKGHTLPKSKNAPIESIDSLKQQDGWGMKKVRQLFHRLLLLLLRFRYSSLCLLFLLFGAALTMFFGSFIGKTNLVRIQFFPDNYSLYYAEITGPPGTPLDKTHSIVKQMAEKIMQGGEGRAESALGFAGYYINEDFSPQYGNQRGYVAVTLPPSKFRRFADYPENDVVDHLDSVREQLKPLVPEGFRLSVRPEKDGPPSGKDINIRMLGQSSVNVSRLAGDIERFLQNSSEIASWLQDFTDDQGSEDKVFRIKVDTDKAAEWGLTVQQVAALAASLTQGKIVGEMKLPEETIDIRLKIAKDGDKETLLPLFDTIVTEYPQGRLRLGDICFPEFTQEPSTLNRFQSQRAITLTGNLKTGAPITSPMVVQSVKEYYSTIRSQYPGAALNFAGEYESTQKSFTSLAYAFVIAVVFMYLILAAQFQSYLQPLIIIAAIVFALTGVIWGTMLSRTLFTVNSFVAIIGVTGVVVNDSLVLVEFINKCYRKGLDRQKALLLATHIRLRPIILTTLTTTLGLLPMALGIPEYSTIWGSMAMTFVTGLCTATFLTIIMIPVLWDITTRLAEKKTAV